MIIGLPKEIKENEYRVAATPAAVATLVRKGNTVLFEHDCGAGSGFSDEEYIAAGGQLSEHEDLYRNSDMIYKVKEIEASEYDLLHEGQIFFSYLHSNAHLASTMHCLKNNITSIAYEDIDDDQGKFPALIPMSILAGKGGFLAALHFSQSVHGGRGLLLNRIPGVPTPEITILDVSWKAMEAANNLLPPNVEFMYSDRQNLEPFFTKETAK